MKHLYLLPALSLCLCVCLSVTAAQGNWHDFSAQGYVVTERGQNFCAWSKVVPRTNALGDVPKFPVMVTNRTSGAWSGPALTCGLGSETGDTNLVGMYFNYLIQDMKEFSDNFQLQWIQLAATTLRINVANTNLAASISTNGLDKAYPIRTWSPNLPSNLDTVGYDTDSPFVPLVASEAFVSNEDSFQSYLLFLPAGGKPVPLKEATWSWSGSAIATTNSPLGFASSSRANPSPAVGQPCQTPPVWTVAIKDVMREENFTITNVWFPTP